MTIHALRVQNPAALPRDFQHWKDVDVLRDLRELEFRGGLNVLFGPNGSGKSTILKLLATLTHCRQGGLPMFTSSSLYWDLAPDRDAPKIDGPAAIVRLDSVPTYYADPSEDPGLYKLGGFDPDFHTDGITAVMSKVSSGEKCLQAVGRILKAAEVRQPRIFKIQDGAHVTSEEHVKQSAAYKAWLQTQEIVPDDKFAVPTMLLDEFDRSLDIPAAHRLWSMMALLWQQKCQIITAGHSPMVIQLADAGLANVIELVPGYMDACRTSMSQFGSCIDMSMENERFGTLPDFYQWRPKNGQPVGPPARAKRKPLKPPGKQS